MTQSTPQNFHVSYIAPNPVTKFNPESVCPTIDESAYIGPFSSVIGDVTIAKNVYVAPNVSIRADEGSPFFIDEDTNLQDGVIMHGLAHGRVEQNGKKYSVYIGKRVSCAHGAILHGPCKVEDDCFVGFYAVLLNCVIGAGTFVGHGAFVTGGVIIPPNRFIPPRAVIDTQAAADALIPIPKDKIEFAEEVIEVNNEFPTNYSFLFGGARCSCGVAYDPESVKDVLK